MMVMEAVIDAAIVAARARGDYRFWVREFMLCENKVVGEFEFFWACIVR
jgi:hypothetical protein